MHRGFLANHSADAKASPAGQLKLVLTPNAHRTIEVGTYGKDVPAPLFSLTFDPDMEEEIGVSRGRVDLPDGPRYVLLYQFHNFGSRPCTITIEPNKPGH